MSNIGELGTLLCKKKIEKKSRNAEKTERGTPLVPSGIVFTRETFLVQFLGSTGTIWRLLKILYNFWGGTVLIISGVSKKKSKLKSTDEKP